jgi:hypothetical protein
MSLQRTHLSSTKRRAAEVDLENGLAEAGLQSHEIEAFLAYSREIEVELGPSAAKPLSSRRTPWMLCAVAALLLFAALVSAAMLLGERGVLETQLAEVRRERDAMAMELRTTGEQKARLEGELASAEREMQRRIADETRVQSELVRGIKRSLLEYAAMGDPRALPTADLLSDVARDLPARIKAGDFRDSWNQLVPPLDPFGFHPSPYDQLELAANLR